MLALFSEIQFRLRNCYYTVLGIKGRCNGIIGVTGIVLSVFTCTGTTPTIENKQVNKLLLMPPCANSQALIASVFLCLECVHYSSHWHIKGSSKNLLKRYRCENASLTIVIFVLFQASKALSPRIRTLLKRFRGPDSCGNHSGKSKRRGFISEKSRFRVRNICSFKISGSVTTRFPCVRFIVRGLIIYHLIAVYL